MRRADFCPYLRPFPPGFTECPAYQPILLVPTDSLGNQLTAVWTCRNLVASDVSEGAAYPRCRLGDAAAREAWASRVGERREALSRVRQGLVEDVKGPLDAFLAEQHRAYSLSEWDRASRLREPAAALVAAFRAAVEKHLDELAQAEFPAATATTILEEMVANWVASSEPVTTLAAPPELIARHPEVKDLLAPER